MSIVWAVRMYSPINMHYNTTFSTQELAGPWYEGKVVLDQHYVILISIIFFKLLYGVFSVLWDRQPLWRPLCQALLPFSSHFSFCLKDLIPRLLTVHVLLIPILFQFSLNFINVIFFIKNYQSIKTLTWLQCSSDISELRIRVLHARILHIRICKYAHIRAYMSLCYAIP